MRRIFANSMFIVPVVIIFLISGCACTKNRGHGFIGGAAYGALAGLAGGAIESDGHDGEGDDVYAGAGIGALVGGLIGLFAKQCKADAESVPVARAQADTDSDGDGVVDSLDRCPGTPAGVPVDYKGCPLDSDNDGVYDNRDRCPDTPEGTEVDTNGCPIDSDGDGVPDGADKCPNTPKGATVNDAGCWVLNSVAFDLDSATLKPSFHAELDNIVDVLKKQPGLEIELRGYTCNLGSEAYNMKLSERRATAVMNYITSKGISSSRISAKWYGESDPIASNDTEKGRKANRRVEITPLY